MNKYHDIYAVELKRYIFRMYPDFVTSMRPEELKQKVPVFMFHRTFERTFEEKLQFLKNNNYGTCVLPDFLEFIRGSRSVPDRTVLLTFDDGDSTVYHTAFPLLKKYGFCAVLFLCPAYIKDREYTFDPSQKTWLNWKEVEEMDKSGIVDIQSHTFDHEKIYVAPRIEGFYKEGYFCDMLGLDIPSAMNFVDGEPIYTARSRMERHKRYYDSPSVRARCASCGKHGSRFLDCKAKKWIKQYKKETRYETDEEQRQNIFNNILKSKIVMEDRLNKKILHLAYPYGQGSKIAVQRSKEAGFVTNFWGPLAGKPTASAGTDPYYIPRLKDDFVQRLPGKNRKPLLSVFTDKIARRMANRDIY